MAYKIIRDYTGALVRRSRDLRAILENSVKRQTYVKAAKLYTQGILIVEWGNGDYSSVQFKDYGVMLVFVMQRNSWIGAEVSINDSVKGDHSLNLMRDLFQDFMQAS